MNKDELLKIYSAYLPYALQLQHKYVKAKHNGEAVLRSWVKPLKPLDLGCLLPLRDDSFEWNPILYDLSYLTKPIEHEGETFVPLIELAKVVSFYEIEIIESYSTSGYDSVVYFKDSKGFYRGFDIVISPEGYLQFSFYTRNGSFASDFNHLRIDHMKVTNKLLSWHFNIFSLPESEYINKATLTNK